MLTTLIVCLIAGVLTDPAGFPVAGARVQSGAASVLTGPDGRFQLPPSSSNRITVTIDGFELEERTVRPPADDLRIQLRLAAVRDNITVTAEEPPASEVAIDTSQLERLPVAANNAIETLAQWIGGEVTVVVDGIETPVAKLSPERIAEVRVNGNPYSAEFSRPGNSRIEVRTKTGADRWRGSLVGAFGSSRLHARPAFAARKPSESSSTVDATVSGPLGRKAALLLSTELEQEREQVLIVARTPSGDLRTALSSPDSELDARAVLNYGPVIIRYSQDWESQTNAGVGGFRLPELAVNGQERERELQLGLQTVTRGWLNETQIRLEQQTNQRVSLTPDQPRIAVDDAFSAGGAQADERHTVRSARISEILTHTRATHTLRLGVQSPGLLRARLDDRAERTGAWRFASLDDYARGTPYAFSLRQGNGLLAYSIQRWAAFLQDEWRVHPKAILSTGVRYETSGTVRDHLNFAPRAALAIHPWGNLVVRAGAGLFFDFLNDSTFRDSLRFDGSRLREVLLRNPDYPMPAGLQLTARPANIVRLHPALRAPHIWETGVSVERAFWAVTWRRSRGQDLFRSRLSWTPEGGQLRLVESEGRSRAGAIEANIRTRKFRIQAQYGRIRSNTEGPNFVPADSLRPDAEWGLASSDRPWRVQAMTTLRAPRRLNVGLIWRAQAGSPYTLRTGRDDNADGLTNDRPLGIPRNTLREPHHMTADIRLGREFRTRNEKRSLECTADAFNLLNRANYTGFVGNLSSPFFGSPTAARSPRRLRLGLRVRF